MTDAPFLQSFVAPVCRYAEGGTITVEQLHGTCFLVGSDGVFLIARHVLEKLFAEIEERGGHAGAFPMQITVGRTESLTVPIIDFVFAPEPFDIAIFKTTYRSSTPFRLFKRDVDVWQDIATMGYPASNANKTSEKYEVQQRAHKGYIQRVVPAGRLHPGTHPDCFELNFSITNGLSGSPLFIHRGEFDEVIGICTHSHESRIVLHSHLDVKDGTAEFSEVLSRVEEFGIAHDLRPLFDWNPTCLNGRTLGQVMQHS
jgi:Trypsin-like peptidase domain